MHVRGREGGLLALIGQEPDDFYKRHFPFECGSRGGKSKTVASPTTPKRPRLEIGIDEKGNGDLQVNSDRNLSLNLGFAYIL
jgi:hypothetical protein